MGGFVYIMSNPSLKDGMLKIGKSSKDPEEFRKMELQTTGIPAPFSVEYYAFVEDHDAVERNVHRALDNHRYRKDREFFILPLTDAIKKIRDVSGKTMQFEKLSEDAKKKMSKGPENESKGPEKDQSTQRALSVNESSPLLLKVSKKPSRWLIGLHFHCGTMFVLPFQVSDELPTLGAIPTIVLLLIGYFFSKLLVSMIWKNVHSEKYRTLIGSLLIAIYFFASISMIYLIDFKILA